MCIRDSGEVDPEGDERHVHFAAAKQLQQLSGVLSLPENPGSLQAMIDGYATETDGLMLMQGEKVLSRISMQFGRNPKYDKICESAAAQLELVRKRIAGDPEGSE